MNLENRVLCFGVLVLSITSPVLVNGRPQISLGGAWLKPVAGNGPVALVPPTNSAGVGSQEPQFTGLIHLQIYLTKNNSADFVKVHEGNSSFSIPESALRGSNSKCGEDWLLNKKDQKCYMKTSSAHCPDDLMEFLELDDEPGVGHCFCRPFLVTPRPIVFWSKNRRCYYIYDKGPCEKGEWLVFSNTTNSSSDEKQPECRKRTCPENTAEDDSAQYPRFWFQHKEKCFKQETENAEFCEQPDLKVYFTSSNTEPQCLDRRPPGPVRGLVSGASDLECKSGFKRVRNGGCKPVAAFDI